MPAVRTSGLLSPLKYQYDTDHFFRALCLPRYIIVSIIRQKGGCVGIVEKLGVLPMNRQVVVVPGDCWLRRRKASGIEEVIYVGR